MAAEDQPLLLFRWEVTRNTGLCLTHRRRIETDLGMIIGMRYEDGELQVIRGCVPNERSHIHLFRSTVGIVLEYLDALGEGIPCTRCQACSCGEVDDCELCEFCGDHYRGCGRYRGTMELSRLPCWGLGWRELASEFNKLVVPGEDRATLETRSGDTCLSLPESLYGRALASKTRLASYFTHPEW